MTAQIHFLNADGIYAAARHVLCSGQFDAEDQAAAVQVLINSADAKNRQLVQLHNRRMAKLLAASRANASKQERQLVTQMQFILLAVAAVGLGIGVVIADWAMTNVIAGVL